MCVCVMVAHIPLSFVKEKEALCRQREQQRVAQRMEAQELARHAQEVKLQQRMERERALQVPFPSIYLHPDSSPPIPTTMILL